MSRAQEVVVLGTQVNKGDIRTAPHSCARDGLMMVECDGGEL